MTPEYVCIHSQVLAVRAHWTQGLDSCNWSMLRSTLTDRVYVDYSAWNQEPGSFHRADDWVERRKGLFPGLWASQHNVSNAIIEVAESHAFGRMYVTAEHILDEDGEHFFTLGGVYEDEYTLSHGIWTLCSMKLTPKWTRGDQKILEAARLLAAAGLGPRSNEK